MFNLSWSVLLLKIPALLTAITFHEWGHAQLADRLGDPTPRHQGRLTLNPLAHLDPLGALMLILVNFGWAKPVQINPRNLPNPDRDMIWVSLAGPGMNLLVAFTSLVLLHASPLLATGWVGQALSYIALINVYLAVFNIIPIPPLDGSKVLRGIAPPEIRQYLHVLDQYGFLILILLLYTGIIGGFLGPLATGVLRFLSQLASLLAGVLTFS